MTKEFKLIDKKKEAYNIYDRTMCEWFEVEDIKECFRLLKESPDFDDEDKAFFNKLTGFSDEEMKK